MKLNLHFHATLAVAFVGVQHAAPQLEVTFR